MKISATNLFNLSHSMAGEYIARFQYPWQALEGLKDFIINLGQSLSPEEYDQLSPDVWVHKTAIIATHSLSGFALHNRAGDRGSPLRLYPRLGFGGRKLCGGQFR